MEGLSMQWCPCGTSSQAIRRPLAVIYPWVWAGAAYVDKYVSLLHSLGCDVLLVGWSFTAMWVPVWARYMAWHVIEAVGKDLQHSGERPVVFFAFSGAAKGVFSSVLSLLARQHPLPQQQAGIAAAVLRCSVGCIYDSCPVDFTSATGKKLLAPHIYTSSGSRPNRTATASSNNSAHFSSRAAAAAVRMARAAATFATGVGCDVTAGTLDFFLLEWFEQDRHAMWTALENTPVRGPVLLLYSRSDELADAVLISQLAGSLRLKGHQVLQQTWQDTPHCGHYRSHPEQYRECVSYLLSQALQEWSARSSRIREGRQWAASWEQQQQHHGEDVRHELDQHQQQYTGYTVHQLEPEQQQQQQQQQLMLQPARGIHFPGGKRQQQAANGPQSHHQSNNTGSSSCSSSISACAGNSRTAHAGTQISISSHCGSNVSGRSLAGVAQQDVDGSTGCCCSGSVLAAVTAAALSDAASAGISTAMANCRISSTNSSGSGHCASSSARGKAGRSQAALPTHSRQQQQQQASRDLTPLVLPSHAAATGQRSRTTDSSRGQHKTSRIADDYCAAASWPGVAAAAAAAAGVSGVAASISTCCGCAASECRCAETLAAASGEIVCSDSTTLSHSLRCMASTYITRQRQQQQDQQLGEQQQDFHHSSRTSSSLVQNRGNDSSCSSSKISIGSSNTSGGLSSSGQAGAAAAVQFSDLWLQQQEHAMLLLQQQQQEQPFVQRVVSRLRSRL